MKLHEDKETGFKWFDSLDDAKADGYTPIKCVSVLQFYTLKGRTSTITKANVEVIRYLQYIVFSPQENRYCFKLFRAYDLETFYFYRRSDTFSGESAEVENLRRFIEDSNVWLLMSPQQISDTTALLIRLWKANLSGEGKVSYKIYLELLKNCLDLEDYKSFGRELTGTKTVQKQYEDKIADLWKQAYESNTVKP